MSYIIKLRVLVDSKESQDTFRDILIPSNYTFLQLHLAIQEAFEFDNSQMASFYMSDDTWDKKEEITLMSMGPDLNGEEPMLMENTPLEDFIDKMGVKILYVFDFMLMWTFFVESVDILDEDEEAIYPLVSNSLGDAPNQYDKEPEDFI